TWADLTELDYRHRKLWIYMAEVFLAWCRRGVDGFRCDAGYMIPLPAWTYIIAKVREEYPDTIFFLEGLGGKISVTRDLLNRGDFNWAYSELFQNYDRGAIEAYLPGALEISQCDGITIHFCETHDNNRLAATSRRFSEMRTALCALASISGGFAFTNGVEWFATEKIDVHGNPSLNWGAKENQVKEIRRLTGLLHHHPAFYDRTHIEMVQEGAGNFLVLWRHHEPTARQLLVVVNLDAQKPAEAAWNPARTRMGTTGLVDLLSGRPVSVARSGSLCRLTLGPGQVYCLTERAQDLEMVQQAGDPGPIFSERLRIQRLRAKVLEVFEHLRGTGHLDAKERDDAAMRLAEDPAEFCRTAAERRAEPRVIFWRWPADVRREVMVPPGFFLLVTADAPFRVRIMDQKHCLAAEECLRSGDGRFFALIRPLSAPNGGLACTVELSVYEAGGSVHRRGRLRLLSSPAGERVRSVFGRPELLAAERLLLGTNGLGGMLRIPVSWGALRSRYDALLAANLNNEAPDDRRILLTRCRAWSVFQGTSQQVGDDCLDAFTTRGESRGFWRFRLPTGQGQHVVIRLGAEMVERKNAVRMVFFREPAGDHPDRLEDRKAVRIIVRPDIEDRSFHEVTKAYMGPETRFPAAVHPLSDGFDFQPAPDRALAVRASTAVFVQEPEWNYMVHRSLEAERGLDPDSDLFSPGYLEARLAGGEHLEITAAAGSRPAAEPLDASDLLRAMAEAFSREAPFDPPAVFKEALSHYVVRRRSLSTVVAGYPWFLDWGRDTLIFVRGLIAAGEADTAARILKQFAAFEENGTLPNMIRGSDARDRDTSDAPLWFFTACADWCDVEKTDALLETAIGSRTVRNILTDMGRAMIAGTPNGIRVDPDSGLLFSPSHFTWMDTNYPAGSPREGYPVEIQALWWAALRFLARIENASPRQPWQKLADQVRRSIAELYTTTPDIGLSDCLHGPPGTPAREASADDALRPNQLFAVTLGAADPDLGKRVLMACSSLLVPGAIRSLADRPVNHPLEIRHQGNLLVDPHHPYQGRYIGDEDTKRKPAYHNGTAWTWVFPSFCEAWANVYPDSGRQTAMAYLTSGVPLLETGCIGHLPEILDGDLPHAPRGCDAQAWGVSEYFRVWKKISRP
ncbi:MAG: amylo-alpha-1,6-glucosidase, partial [Desulfobacterales bacterium]